MADDEIERSDQLDHRGPAHEEVNIAVCILPIEDLDEMMRHGGTLPDDYKLVGVEPIIERHAVRLYISGPGIPERHRGASFPALSYDVMGTSQGVAHICRYGSTSAT